MLEYRIISLKNPIIFILESFSGSPSCVNIMEKYLHHLQIDACIAAYFNKYIQWQYKSIH